MTTAVLTPTNSQTAKPVAGRLWRKQVLPRGKSIDYTDPATGAKRTLNFTDDYLQGIVDSFSKGAYDAVKFQIADAKNTHTEDPERARGTVRAFELTSDGLDMVVDLTDDGAKLIADNPDLPVSARIVEGLARADGATFPVAIRHVLGTLDPRVAGMSPWQAVADLAGDTDVPTVDLTAEEYPTPKKEGLMADLTAKLRKAFGLGDSATEDEIIAAAEAKLADPPKADDETLTPEEIAELERLANEQSVEASLTAEAQQQIDLANANAEQAVARAKALEVAAAKSAWTAESQALLHAGVPKSLVDLAAPWCGGDAPAGFIDLANTDTTVENVREAAAADMRRMLDTHKGLIDLSVIGETPDPDEDKAAAEARQEAVRKHRQAAGI